MFEQAKIILREFGGLRVRRSGPGHDFARTGFQLDPTLAVGESDRFSRLEAGAGARLFPLGEADEGNVFLAVAENGRVFILMDELQFIGSSIEEALNSLLEGRLPKAKDALPNKR